MALPPVQIDMPRADIGETMSKIRSWLDANRIEAVEFKSSMRTDSIVSFMLRFEKDADAISFGRAFLSD